MKLTCHFRHFLARTLRHMMSSRQKVNIESAKDAIKKYLSTNFPISLRDGLVIDVSFVCEFKGSSRAPGGWNNDVRHSKTSYRPVQTSRTTNTRTFIVHKASFTRRLHLPS